MSRLITGLILGGLFICYAWSCGDDYMTVERRIIDADNRVPVYFYAEAEQAGSNTWKPVFTYLIYSLEEGEYDAYFHAYMIDSSDSVLWSGIQPIQIEELVKKHIKAEDRRFEDMKEEIKWYQKNLSINPLSWKKKKK